MLFSPFGRRAAFAILESLHEVARGKESRLFGYCREFLVGKESHLLLGVLHAQAGDPFAIGGVKHRIDIVGEISAIGEQIGRAHV